MARIRTRTEINEEPVRLLELDNTKCLITKLTTGSNSFSPGTCIHVISNAPGSPTKERKKSRQDFENLIVMHRSRETQQCWFVFVQQDSQMTSTHEETRNDLGCETKREGGNGLHYKQT